MTSAASARDDADSGSDEDAGRTSTGAAGAGQVNPGRPDAGTRTPSTSVMTSAMTPTDQQRDAGAARDAGAPTRGPSEAGSSAPPSDAGTPRDAGATTAPPEPDPHCREGNYVGTFSGMIRVFGLALSTVTGTVRTELRINPAGTYLEIRDARVMGVDQDGNSLTVDLSGNVNCMTNELEDGTLTNGTFHNVAANSDTPFNGAVMATYSDDPHSVVGTWTVQARDFAALLSGNGTWSLIYTP